MAMTFRRFTQFCSLGLIGLSLSHCALKPPPITIPATPPPVKKLTHRPQIALVLGSGGARGYAHLGVLQVLRQAGVPVNLIVGASVGSIVGSLYADHGSWKEAYAKMMKGGFWTFADIAMIPRSTGIMSGYHLQRFIFNSVDAKQFRQLKIPLAVVTTDLTRGQPFIIRSGPIAPAAEASATIPGIVQPAHLYGRVLVDGGVTDPVPVDVAESFHPKLIIAVNINQKLSSELPVNQLGIIKRSLNIIYHRLAKIGSQQADVILHPKVGFASTFATKNKYILFKEGQQAARKALPKILRLMRARGIPRQYDKS